MGAQNRPQGSPRVDKKRHRKNKKEKRQKKSINSDKNAPGSKKASRFVFEFSWASFARFLLPKMVWGAPMLSFISFRSLLWSILSSQTDPPTFKNGDFTMRILTFLKKQRFRSKDGLGSVWGLTRAPFGRSWARFGLSWRRLAVVFAMYFPLSGFFPTLRVPPVPTLRPLSGSRPC